MPPAVWSVCVSGVRPKQGGEASIEKKKKRQLCSRDGQAGTGTFAPPHPCLSFPHTHSTHVAPSPACTTVRPCGTARAQTWAGAASAPWWREVRQPPAPPPPSHRPAAAEAPCWWMMTRGRAAAPRRGGGRRASARGGRGAACAAGRSGRGGRPRTALEGEGGGRARAGVDGVVSSEVWRAGRTHTHDERGGAKPRSDLFSFCAFSRARRQCLPSPPATRTWPADARVPVLFARPRGGGETATLR